MNNNLNVLNKFNEIISISSIVIFYEFILLILYLMKIISHQLVHNLVSPLILLNFFIIFVVFTNSCDIDYFTKLWVVTLKMTLLFFILLFAKFSYKNYFIGILFLILYYISSNINKVYSCNVKYEDLVISLILSSIAYFYGKWLQN